ncbi:lipopolysaccharide-induced tumor necrosis factor-alpha factor homolog [Pectinophora gossypiella]|uniref:lipopolysaccharide-induced tumor necrosis factor-alpha factor homolog n=1 Tax=Pectinophora gossypiella TaxID=13191 RepID=UPI00214E125A|nr:lipopolysaccharide-induced tumor necrosis factor-alpha factor homolog [Pectinophora gossypiella]
MHVESGAIVNQGAYAELRVQSETVNFQDPPPPYTPPVEGPTVTSQPIIHQTIILQVPLRSNPVYYTCDSCHERVYTKVKYVNSRKTHLLAGFICGFTCWCLICCLGAIPYLVKSFKKAEHYCPNCDKLLGTYSKI